MSRKAEKIINATVDLFLKEGVKYVTMDDIAENAKSSKVTVYKYFSDKDTLYFQVGKYIFQCYAQQLEKIVFSTDKLTLKLKKYLDVIREFTDSGNFMLCKELAEYNIDLNNEYNNYQDIYKNTILALIDQGIQEKQIKSSLDRMLVFSYIDMGVEYYQNNVSYRYKISNDKNFQENFMLFYIGNIFKDYPQ